jgi:ABC-type transport system involved in cytochrome bd biosynthesis fused ATPase/permease subunit
LKLAMGAALGGPVDFMLFDEVSAAGEDENALLLTSLLKGVGAQVILISHRQADCAVADHVIALG